MKCIWLKQYPPGVPADIEPTQYASLVDLLEESFTKFADRKAFICMDKSISYRDLDQMSVALAAYLQGRGLQRGARVAIMMPNVLQYPVAAARCVLQRRAVGRPRHVLQQAQAVAGRRRFPAIYRRHHRRFQGGDAAPPQHRRQRAAERRLAPAGAGAAAADRSAPGRLRAAALPHLRADGLLPARGARRRLQSPDPQSSRYRGL